MPRRKYPKEISVGSETYSVTFVKKFEDPQCRGECDSSTQSIRILSGMTKAETLQTLVHEVLHAIEFTYELNFPHNLIYKLEEPLYRLILDNF